MRPLLFTSLSCIALLVACAPEQAEMSKDEVRQLVEKGDHVVDWCELFDWYGDGICDEFCASPDPDCEIHGPCGDGTALTCQTLVAVPDCPQGQVHETIDGCYGQCVDAVSCLPPPVTIPECGDGTLAICEIFMLPCEDGLVREVVDNCFGECVVPETCETPCQDNIDCADGFCGWADDDSTRICKDYAVEGESCGGFVLPSYRNVCDPELSCIHPEATHDLPGTCMRPLHSGECGDGSLAVCEILPAACPLGQVREVVNGCFGDCVSALTCLPPPSFN